VGVVEDSAGAYLSDGRCRGPNQGDL
jgi:hypothetical protein